MKKNIFKFFLISILLGVISSPCHAVDPTKAQIRQEIKEKKEELKPTILAFKGKAAKIIGGQISGLNNTVLTVTKEGKSYTIATSANTQFRRHFWGKAELSEMSVGDNVNVWGKWADDTQTTINAYLIRNTSIMKRFGVFLGTVKSKSDQSFVLQTVERGDQTVYLDSKTKFTDRKGASSYSQVNTGDRVKVRGMWDKTLSKITEVTLVKDFSQPVKPSLSPKS
jgi:hypothetical protein